MNLKVIGTGSTGNCYILENANEALIIECGVRISEIKKALNFNLNKVVGCIVSHEHGDHSKSMKDLSKLGVKVYATEGTHEKVNTSIYHRTFTLKYNQTQRIGNFKIFPFATVHDAVEPCGFFINHKETGNTLFLTDTLYSKFTFPNLSNIIIEANYSTEIINRKYKADELQKFLRNRIIKSHLSLNNCIDILKSNDLTKVNKIILIHLSDSNSDELDFLYQVHKETDKHVIVASNGLEIEFNKTPF